MKHPLTDVYRVEREELLALGRSIDDATGSQMTSACPAWSIADVYRHLAGISTDIINGNTEGAATEAWANAHVAARVDLPLAEVLDEWDRAGADVSATMAEAGEFFPLPLFIDQFTHGWDIRAALGNVAAAVPELSVYQHYLDEFMERMGSEVIDGLGLELVVEGETIQLGQELAVGSLELDLFEFARISMGRRSLNQLRQLPWPRLISDPQPYIDAMVVWSVNDHDVVDPVLV